MADDTTGERGAEPGFDLHAAEPPSEPIGFGVGGERAPHRLDRGA
jgi:hypothetical protein